MDSQEDHLTFDGRWLQALRPTERNTALRNPPEWFLFLSRAYQSNSPACNAANSQEPFANAIIPLCVEANRLVRLQLAGFGKGTERAIDLPALVDGLGLQLRKWLAAAAAKCFLTTMGALAESGELPGRTPQERYGVYTDCLRDPSFTLTILERFPVLSRRVSVMAMNWCNAVVEFIARFINDRDSLTERGMLRSDSGRLLGAEAVGDPHRGGRQGYLLTFESGDRLVYKARSVEPEAQFQTLLDWIAARDTGLKLRSYRVLSRGGYGWSEFIRREPCATANDIEQFFFRQGAHLALLHLLRGTDMHHENVIACGSHPILVDLETLHHPVRSSQANPTASECVHERLTSSVRRTHLLPIVMGQQDRESGRLDVGGLGFSDDQNRMVETFAWADKGSDAMRMEKRIVTVEAKENLPTLEGTRVDVRPYSEWVVDGFERMHRFVGNHSSELLSDKGPLNTFRAAIHRIIPRATEFYSELLFDSCDPDLNEDAESLEEYLVSRLKTASQPHLNDIVAKELDDLWQGDVPYFCKLISEESARASDGAKVGIFGLSNAWDDCVCRMRDAGEDRKLQVQLIRWSLYDLKERFDRVPTSAILQGIREERPDPIAIATRFADCLAERAVWRDGRASWLTVNDAIDGRFIPKVASYGLYDGLSGIALAFLYLGHVLGEKAYSDTAHAALNEALELVREQEATSLGAFDGLGGLIYALSHASACSGDRKWLAAAKAIAHSARERIDKEKPLDVISGHAGFIACLVALHRLDRDPSILEIAKASARVLASAPHDDPEAQNRLKDVNFAHGRAGIGWALLVLDGVCSDPALRKLGQDLTLHDLNNWRPELLNSTASASLATLENGDDHLAWCSGPLGIILSLISYDGAVGAIPIAAIARALIKGLRPGACKGRLALCHGDLGNIELILEATRRGILRSPAAFTEFSRQIVDRLRSDACKQDLSIALDCPGLMTGQAGVIYGLLRTAFPDDVPSVLVLEPPSVK